MIKYFLIAIFSGLLSTFSQILLKKSALEKKDSILQEYINIKVFISYGITFLCMFLTIIAFKGMPYKYGSIIESLTYIYIMVFSRIFIGEKITKNRLSGNILIAVGIIIFSLGK